MTIYLELFKSHVKICIVVLPQELTLFERQSNAVLKNTGVNQAESSESSQELQKVNDAVLQQFQDSNTWGKYGKKS